MPLQLNNESDAFLITYPINIRGKGVILITEGPSLADWEKRRDEEKENKVLTQQLQSAANFEKLLNDTFLKGQSMTFSTNKIMGKQNRKDLLFVLA